MRVGLQIDNRQSERQEQPRQLAGDRLEFKVSRCGMCAQLELNLGISSVFQAIPPKSIVMRHSAVLPASSVRSAGGVRGSRMSDADVHGSIAIHRNGARPLRGNPKLLN